MSLCGVRGNLRSLGGGLGGAGGLCGSLRAALAEKNFLVIDQVPIAILELESVPAFEATNLSFGHLNRPFMSMLGRLVRSL